MNKEQTVIANGEIFDAITEPQEWIDGLVEKYAPNSHDIDVSIQNMGLELTRLQTKVDELEKDSTEWEDAAKRITVLVYRAQQERDTLQESEAALKVMVERLREALDAIYNHNEAARAAVISHYGTSHKTPAQSLVAYNQKIERETIERIIKVADATQEQMDEKARDRYDGYDAIADETIRTSFVYLNRAICSLPSAYGEESSRLSGDRNHSEELEGCKRYYKEENSEEH